MQIPVIGGGQRLDPSSPVPVASSDSAAGNLQGNMMESFGNAMFKLGNELDKAGKRAKEDVDRLNVQIAINDARFAMLQEQAKQNAAAVNPEDRADGFSGVQRFKENSDARFAEIAERLPDPKQKQMFYAGIGDDAVRSSTLVLADEVQKREKALPILRQDNLQGKSRLAWDDPNVAYEMADKWEADILADTSLSPADKLATIKAGKQEIIKGAVNGMLSRGGNGKQTEWNNARWFINNDAMRLFNDEERDKMLSQVNEAENAYYTHDWQNYTQVQRRQEDKRKQDERTAISEYTSALSVAGNDQHQFNAIQSRVQLDPRLSGEAVKRLQENRAFMETKDDDYEGSFMTTLLKKKNFAAMIDKVNTDYIGGTVSSDRRDKLLKAVQNMQEMNRKDPFLMKMVDQARDEINQYKKPPTLDPVSGLYKSENDTYNEQAQTQFMQRITVAAQGGQLTAGGVQSILSSTLSKFYGGRSVHKPVTGVAPENLTTSKGIQQTIDALYADYLKNGKNWSPEKKRKAREQLPGLKENRNAVKNREDARVNPLTMPNTNKVYDE